MSARMEATIDGGKLLIDLYNVIGAMTGDERATIIDALACQGEVIDEVMNQVFDGFTSHDSHALTSYGGDPNAVYGLDGARMRIAKQSSEVAAKEIERLGAAIQSAKDLGDKGWAAYHELLERQRKGY